MVSSALAKAHDDRVCSLPLFSSAGLFSSLMVADRSGEEEWNFTRC